MARRVCGGWLATQTRNYCQLFDCHWRTDWRTQQRDFGRAGDEGGVAGRGREDWLERVDYLRRLFVANSLDIRSHVPAHNKSLSIGLQCPTGHQVANRRRWPRSGRGPWTSWATTHDPPPPTTYPRCPISEQRTCCAGIPHWRNCDKFKCGFLVVLAWQELWGDLNEFVLVNGLRYSGLYRGQISRSVVQLRLGTARALARSSCDIWNPFRRILVQLYQKKKKMKCFENSNKYGIWYFTYKRFSLNVGEFD